MKAKLTLSLLLATFLFMKPDMIKAQVNIQDSLALVDLYNSTDGPNWIYNEYWLSEKPVNLWHGVGFYDKRVISLDLR